MLEKKNFKKYTLADLITIYSFLNDYDSYSSFYSAITDVEDEVVFRFGVLMDKEM